jgi:hypothetical protein
MNRCVLFFSSVPSIPQGEEEGSTSKAFLVSRSLACRFLMDDPTELKTTLSLRRAPQTPLHTSHSEELHTGTITTRDPRLRIAPTAATPPFYVPWTALPIQHLRVFSSPRPPDLKSLLAPVKPQLCAPSPKQPIESLSWTTNSQLWVSHARKADDQPA